MEHVRVPLRDGCWLAGDLFRPGDDLARPAIVVQTPYGKERLGAALPHPSARSWLDFWDRDRFALLIVDWRGYHASAEAGDGRRRSHRGADGKDVTEWVSRQPWCDGRIAAWGPSALGRALLRTAAARPPSLVCGVPVVCHMGHYYEDFYEGGVLQKAHVEAIRNLGFRLAPEVLNEPFRGAEFYRKGAAESRPERLNLPLLLVTGWFDLVAARTLRFYADLRRRGGARTRTWSRLVIGPWHHTAIDHRRQGDLAFDTAAGAGAEEVRRFLDYWVLGDTDNGWDSGAPVRFWPVGEDGWVDADGWPPMGLTETTRHLHADGSLSGARPPGGGTVSFVADPADPVPTIGGGNLPLGLDAGPKDQREIERREDVATFTTEVLQESLRLCGEGRVTLTVSTDRPDADVAIRLTDVQPDGGSYLVGDTIRRLKLAKTLDHPDPVPPGEKVRLEIPLPPIAWTFHPGHRIRLIVAGSNHPRFELNPHTGADRFDPETAVPAEITLHIGGDAEAAVRFPVRKGA
jgi:predicted acyl esterase